MSAGKESQLFYWPDTADLNFQLSSGMPVIRCEIGSNIIVNLQGSLVSVLAMLVSFLTLLTIKLLNFNQRIRLE